MMESYTNGDTISSRVGTSGRPSSGVTEEYTAKMIQAREAKMALLAYMKNMSNHSTKTLAFGSTPLDTSSFLRQAKVLTSSLKELNWVDQRTILIQSYLLCDSKEKDFLTARAATLRQINRRKRIRNRNKIESAKSISLPSSMDLQSSSRKDSVFRCLPSQDQRSPPSMPSHSLRSAAAATVRP